MTFNYFLTHIATSPTFNAPCRSLRIPPYFGPPTANSFQKNIRHSHLTSPTFALPIGIEISIPSVPNTVSIVTPPNYERHRRHHSFNMAGINDDHGRSTTSLSSNASSFVSIPPPTESSLY